MKIAIDAMGGDFAPTTEVQAGIQALDKYPDLQLVFFGDEAKIKEELPADKLEDPAIQIVHTTEVITMEDEPVRSIRRKKDSSLVRAARALKEGQVDGMVSAGNTGALLAAGLLIVGRIKGIDRPGLMALIPHLEGDRPHFIFMDAGANADSKALNIHQFAILANYYAKEILHIDQARVALLNNGAEASKGSSLTKEVYELLSHEKNLNFIGNLESKSLLKGQADIVVTDGFTGNAVLKNIEGVAIGMTSYLKKLLTSSGFKTKLGALLIKDSLKNGLASLDPSKAGGAVLLGIKGPLVKAHGSSNPQAFEVAISQVREMVEGQVIEKISKYYSEDYHENP